MNKEISSVAPTFIVSEKAQRRAMTDGTCFYCSQPIGSAHAADCTLIKKKVNARVVINYEIEVPACWDKETVELLLDHDVACLNGGIPEFADASATFECVDDQGSAYLSE